MLSRLQDQDREIIDQLITERASALGISPERLEEEAAPGCTYRQLLLDMIQAALEAICARNNEELRRRRKEGLARAQAQGVAVGRPSKRSEKRFEKLRQQYEKKEVSAEQAARQLHVSISTFYRWLRETRS